MKKYLVIITLSFLFSCKGKKEKENVASDSVNQCLSNQVKEKEETIDGYIKSFNEIQDNLNQIKIKEKVVAVSSQSIELQKSNKEQIISDIQFIYDLLNKNRQALTAMANKFNETTAKSKALQHLISNLTIQVSDQETEITNLKKTINTLKTELDLLNISATKDAREAYLQTHFVYCAIGTFDELKSQRLITEKGGVIGIGKVTEMDPNFNKDIFSVINMYQTTEISIAANEVKLISPHPDGSYKMEDTKLKIKKLVILNPQDFWSVSKYLIIMVSADKPAPHKPNAGLSGIEKSD